ncbi:MAG: hypothetical protein ACOCWS_02840, partial [Alkalispirochaetaceae bacterium]
MRRRIVVLPAALALLLLLALSGCQGPGDGGNGGERSEGEPGARGVAEGDEVETVFAVNVTPAIEGEIRDYIEVNGEIETTATI